MPKFKLTKRSEFLLKVLIVLSYGLFYLATFAWLEGRDVKTFHIIRVGLDYKIPFCEYFVIPYFMWFLYIAATVILFLFLDRKDFIKLCITLGTGMTLFLVISYFIPNMQPLRPHYFARDNIFVDMVKGLYATDTATNVFPSIHVYNSFAASFAILNAKQLKKYRWLRIGSTILTILITLSTMFIKQHSLFDVCTGLILAAVMYYFVYAKDAETENSVQKVALANGRSLH